MVKEKLWTLISQNEPSLVQISLVIFSVDFFWNLFCDLRSALAMAGGT